MYSTCIFCNKPLGSNEVIERFPVGRRIAFDSAMGRLWVVCRSCERWNLSPLEDRLEVIDECERLYSIERKRVSTENIGLAKLNEGLELVRIGQPQRPEFAAWRYGDQFGRRRRRNVMISGAGVVAVGGIWALGWTIGGAGILMMNSGGEFVKRFTHGSPNKVMARVAVGEAPFQNMIDIKRKHLDNLILTADSIDGYGLLFRRGKKLKEVREIRGESARLALQKVLPAINRYGGNQKTVSSAVSLIEHLPDPHDFVKSAAKSFAPTMRMQKADAIRQLPGDVRLALEMAVHEEAERRALEGELKGLELAWREAEQIASISDSLFTSSFITSAIERMKK